MQMQYRTVLVLLLLMLVGGCGTLNSTFYGDSSVKADMKRIETKCDSMARIYSGVFYDFCSLHARPGPVHTRSPFTDTVPFLLTDMAASGIFDTLLLPYSIYRQTSDGSIFLK